MTFDSRKRLTGNGEPISAALTPVGRFRLARVA